MTPSSTPGLRVGLLAGVACLIVALLAGVALAAPSSGVAAPAPALDDSIQPRVVDLSNTSNYLQPDADETVRTAVSHQDVDAGVAVATGAETLAGHHDRLTFERRLASAPNQSARLEVIGEAVTALEDRTARLRGTRLELMRAFQDGSLSAREYFRQTARLDGAVDRASAHRENLETIVEEQSPRAQEHLTALRHLEADLDTMAGPVTNRIRGRYAGNASSGATYVMVTDNDGFVHATVGDGLLVREAQETDDWTRDGSGTSSDLTAVLNRAEELYPWTFSHQFGSQSDFYDTSLYKVAVAHQHGDLTVFLDGTTDDVFREVQRNRLNAIPRNWTRSATVDGVQLTLNGSHGTGPLSVQVTDPTDGTGIASDVRIDESYVGRTDQEGELWTVQPTGEFTVNATTANNETVSMTVPADVD